MKLVLFIILIFFIRVNAQTSANDTISSSKDTINVHQLVQEQISKIQENQKNISNKHVDIDQDWGTSNKQNSSIASNDVLNSGLKYKFAAIILAMIISTGYVVIKRKKAANKNDLKRPKENLFSAKTEKPIRRERNELSIIRENLKKNAVFLSPHDREISKSAKELKIAKGELYLAAELKSLELTKIGSKKTNFVEMI